MLDSNVDSKMIGENWVKDLNRYVLYQGIAL